jgi:ABC-type transport system involved in multi-copper enzyme maturation permease subunit
MQAENRKEFEGMFKNGFIGGIWPVVQRELREGARHPFNYWLRVEAAGAGLLMVVYVIMENRDETDKVMGQYLFAGLHVALMGLICLVVPLMTADCIAREKREGTLGLLFLTPLTAGGIVMGKGLVQALRALTMWVSVAPILTIPFLTGGVAWADASASFSLELSALVLCLAAGLLASTLVKGRGAAFVLALFLGVLIVAVFCLLVCFCFLSLASLMAYWPIGYAFPLSGLSMDNWQDYLLPLRRGSSAAAIGNAWHQILWLSPIAALLLFVLVVGFAAWRLAGSWQDKIPSIRQESLVRRYCTPVFKGWFARRMGRVLDRNPIVWLQQYSWKARLIKWVLCLAFMILVTALLDGGIDPDTFVETVEPILFLAIVAGMTFAGINSLAEEKHSGALELILVTPIPINKIILGRVWCVWEQYLPAALLLGCSDFCLAVFGGAWGSENRLHYLTTRLAFLCIYFTLPVIALYCALRLKNQIAALAMTWFLLFLPYLCMTPLVWVLVQMGFLSYSDMPEFWETVALPLANLALALAAFFHLRHRLTRRLYSFS